jgi:hypothetical protein
MPISLPRLDNRHPSPPHTLEDIIVYPSKQWDSQEWDHPDAKDVLKHLCKIYYDQVVMRQRHAVQ